MLKMVAGDPPNQILVLGLAFGNLDKFKAEPFVGFGIGRYLLRWPPSAVNIPPHRRRGSQRDDGSRSYFGQPGPAQRVFQCSYIFRVYVAGREDRGRDGDARHQLDKPLHR